MKFILKIRNLDLQFCVVEYQANPIPSLYGTYNQAEFILLILQTQAQLKKNQEQKQKYKAFRSFQVLVEKNYHLHLPYNLSQRQTQLVQPNLSYQELKKFEHNNSYSTCNQQPTSTPNMYTLQDVQAQEFYQNHILRQAFFNSAMSCKPFVNGYAQYIYQWENPLCYKYSTLRYTSPEYNSHMLLLQAESQYLRNLYQRPFSNRGV